MVIQNDRRVGANAKVSDEWRLGVVDFTDVGEKVSPKPVAVGDRIGNRVERWGQQDEFVVEGRKQAACAPRMGFASGVATPCSRRLGF